MFSVLQHRSDFSQNTLHILLLKASYGVSSVWGITNVPEMEPNVSATELQ